MSCCSPTPARCRRPFSSPCTGRPVREVPTGGTDLVVAPGAQIVVPLAGLLLGEESPVIRVTATGAPVQAALQTSITRTLVPGGVDQVGAIAIAEASQVIPGVVVTQNPGADGASDAATKVRILSPNADTTATITAVPIGASQQAPAPTTVPLTAGLPTEVELGGLAVGQYTIEVSAEAAGPRRRVADDGLRRGSGLRVVHVCAGGRGAEPVRHAAGTHTRAHSGQPDGRAGHGHGGRRRRVVHDADHRRRAGERVGAADGADRLPAGCRRRRHPGGRIAIGRRRARRVPGVAVGRRRPADRRLPRGRVQKNRKRSGPRSHGSRSRYSAAARKTLLSTIMRRCRSSSRCRWLSRSIGRR